MTTLLVQVRAIAPSLAQRHGIDSEAARVWRAA
jgi:hypothetical protein